MVMVMMMMMMSTMRAKSWNFSQCRAYLFDIGLLC